jgi:hypothetical protein
MIRSPLAQAAFRGLLEMFYRFAGDAVLNSSLIWRSDLVLLAFSNETGSNEKGRVTGK